MEVSNNTCHDLLGGNCMAKMIDEFIQNKGIIKCIDKNNDVYYLDIEEHIIYTEKEMLKMAFERK
jgi:hypothetical protein